MGRPKLIGPFCRNKKKQQRKEWMSATNHLSWSNLNQREDLRNLKFDAICYCFDMDHDGHIYAPIKPGRMDALNDSFGDKDYL